MDAAALDRVYEAFQDFHDYCAPVFGRKQWRERSGQYLQALLVQSQERQCGKPVRDGYSVAACAAAFSYRSPLG